MECKDAIYEAFQSSKKDGSLTFKDLPSLPLYAHINTLLTTIPKVVKNLRRTGFYQIYYRKEISENEYLDLVRNLEAGSFLIDYHFKDLLVFAGNENLTTWSLYEKNYVYLQDKSSYIPIFALDPKPGSMVIDACAAPKMKLIHIAACMENKGKIYAYEKDNDRFKILKKILNSTLIEIFEAHCEDFCLVNTNDPKFRDLEYILVDLSCFGSSRDNHMDAVTDTKDSKNAVCLQKLVEFQILLLKHALTFPSVKRVVYSTGSITEEENEYVVHEVLAHFKFIFKLVSVLPDWPVRGSDNYEYGNLCLRAYPDKTLTSEFFVAMFERMDYDEQQKVRSLADEELFSSQDTFSKKRRKGKSKLRQENCKTGLHCNISGNNIKVSGQEENSHFINGDSSFHFDFLSKKKEATHDTDEAVDFQEVPNYRNSNNNIELGTNENHSYKEHPSIIAGDIMEEENYSDNSSVHQETSFIRIKKKKHKRKSCHETELVSNNPVSVIVNCPPNYEPTTETQDNFDQKESTGIQTKKKKHKRKHCEGTSHNFERITEACPPYCELAIRSQDIFVQEESMDVKTKKKKHKPKHHEATSDNSKLLTKAFPPDYKATIESQVNFVQEESTYVKTKKKIHPDTARKEEEEEEVMLQKPETEDAHEQMPTDYTLRCHIVRIGAYQVRPTQTHHHVHVVLSVDSISFQAPVLAEPNKLILITLRNHDIIRVLVHFGRCLPVMYVYTTAAYGEAVRNALHMSQRDSRYFDPTSKDDKTQKLSFLIDSMTEEQRQFIRQCFLGDKKVKEIDQKQANDILVKSTPTQKNLKFFKLKFPCVTNMNKQLKVEEPDAEVEMEYDKEGMDEKEGLDGSLEEEEEEEVMPEKPEPEDAPEQMPTDYTLRCRIVRIGAYEVRSTQTHHVHVVLSVDSISFQAPVLAEPNKLILITLRNHDIIRALVHFGRCLPVMYVYTTAAFGEAVRNALHMSQIDPRYFDPVSKDDKTQKLTFLIDSMTEEQRQFIRQCFPGDKKVKEIDQKQANDILVKSTPNQVMILNK